MVGASIRSSLTPNDTIGTELIGVINDKRLPSRKGNSSRLLTIAPRDGVYEVAPEIGALNLS